MAVLAPGTGLLPGPAGLTAAQRNSTSREAAVGRGPARTGKAGQPSGIAENGGCQIDDHGRGVRPQGAQQPAPDLFPVAVINLRRKRHHDRASTITTSPADGTFRRLSR